MMLLLLMMLTAASAQLPGYNDPLPGHHSVRAIRTSSNVTVDECAATCLSDPRCTGISHSVDNCWTNLLLPGPEDTWYWGRATCAEPTTTAAPTTTTPTTPPSSFSCDSIGRVTIIISCVVAVMVLAIACVVSFHCGKRGGRVSPA